MDGALAGGAAARELHLLDGADPSGLFGELAAGGGRFSPANTLVISVSKSGDTENVVQETRLLAERGFPVLAVIGPGPSKLTALAEEKGFDRFPHPEEVGGRFTAGQNTALLPLSLALGGADAARAVDAAFEEAHSRLAPSVFTAGNMAKALALESGRLDITVNAIAPGYIATEMLASAPKEFLDDIIARTPVQRLGTPADIGRAVVFLAADQAGFITGSVTAVTGGYHPP